MVKESQHVSPSVWFTCVCLEFSQSRQKVNIAFPGTGVVHLLLQKSKIFCLIFHYVVVRRLMLAMNSIMDRYTLGKITPIQRREVRTSYFGPRASFWMNFPKEGSQLTPPHQSEDFMSRPKPERVQSVRKTSQSICRFFFFLSFLTIQSTKIISSSNNSIENTLRVS